MADSIWEEAMVTYTFDCGCKLECTSKEIIHLRIEPNWGCLECGEGTEITDIREWKRKWNDQ